MTDGFTAKETDVEAVSTSVPETTNHLIEVIEIVNFLLQGINPAQKILPTLKHLGTILPVHFLMEFLKLPSNHRLRILRPLTLSRNRNTLRLYIP